MDIKSFLDHNVVSATGCTEPVAVGYATALAYHSLFGETTNDRGNIQFSTQAKEICPNFLEEIIIETDRNTYKNAFAVSIPGTEGKKGITLASAIGLYCNPEFELNLFREVSPEIVCKANSLLDKIHIKKSENLESSNLNIKVTLKYSVDGQENIAYTQLTGIHDHVYLVKVNRKVVYQSVHPVSQQKDGENFPETLKQLLTFAENADSEDLERIQKGIEMNLSVAKEGLSANYGLNTGKTLASLADEEILGKSLISEIKIKAAAASDARMGGVSLPIMTSSGSGNQGITALIPIAIVGEHYNFDTKKINQAALLSHLVTHYSSLKVGHLSAICGCAIKAGLGATAGLTYLMGGNEEEINAAINLMAANITGMVCDGAKEGCALKLSTSAGIAAESAFMALKGMRIPTDNGIVFSDAMKTIAAIGKIASTMIDTDQAIVEIMQSKNSLS
jgi:L-cysteine desulfidase